MSDVHPWSVRFYETPDSKPYGVFLVEQVKDKATEAARNAEGCESGSLDEQSYLDEWYSVRENARRAISMIPVMQHVLQQCLVFTGRMRLQYSEGQVLEQNIRNVIYESGGLPIIADVNFFGDPDHWKSMYQIADKTLGSLRDVWPMLPVVDRRNDERLAFSIVAYIADLKATVDVLKHEITQFAVKIANETVTNEDIQKLLATAGSVNPDRLIKHHVN